MNSLSYVIYLGFTRYYLQAFTLFQSAVRHFISSGSIYCFIFLGLNTKISIISWYIFIACSRSPISRLNLAQSFIVLYLLSIFIPEFSNLLQSLSRRLTALISLYTLSAKCSTPSMFYKHNPISSIKCLFLNSMYRWVLASSSNWVS